MGLEAHCLRLFVISMVFLNCLTNTNAQCPCSSEKLCEPIPKTSAKELAVFITVTDDSWKKWNWTEITTIILVGNLDQSEELYCYARSRNVRATTLVSADVSKLTQTAYRKQVLNSWVTQLKQYHLDGLNLDLEGNAFNQEIVDSVTAITRETRMILKSLNHAFTVSFDVPYSPDIVGCLTGFCYDFVALANYTDYLIVMDYDATLDVLVANANSPLNLITLSYHLYITNLSIPASHLVMAVPWYGYDYTCSKFYNRTGYDLCVILDSQESQKNFADIMKVLNNDTVQGGLKWDEKSASPYFTTLENGVYHQYWFDDVQSLKMKYELGLKLNLGGFTMWRAETLDYSSTDLKIKSETAAMWNTLSEYAYLLKRNK